MKNSESGQMLDFYQIHSVIIEKKHSKKLHIITEQSSYIYSTENLFPVIEATVRDVIRFGLGVHLGINIIEPRIVLHL